MAKRKISKKKTSKLILILLIIIVIIGLVFYLTKNDKKTITKVESIDKIDGYGYTLGENATKYYKSLFKQLKEVLESDEVDEAKYADLVVKMFVADFYNLDNKINKNDIGGVQFVYTDFQNDFEKIAGAGIYKNVENNLYGKRDQTLPVVESVSTEKKDSQSFTYGDKTDDKAYTTGFEITYKEDLGYQTSGDIILIHNGKKLEVASLTK